MSMLEGNPRLGEIFIEEKSPNSENIWRLLDSSMANGSRMWFHSPLLKSLNKSIGYKFGHKRWLLVQPLRNTKIEWLYRIRDIFFSIFLLIILSPLMLLVAFLVKISSPGPVFYKTQVVGQSGKQFYWRKFRSMRVVPETVDIEQRRKHFRVYAKGRLKATSKKTPIKIIDYSRVTLIGRIIRKYSIDELPQLWNVLCGHVSLVGPRPCLPYESEFYNGWMQRRFNVPAGVTGVWQVFGRGRVGFEESAAMDAYYAYRRSFGFDLYLIFKTAVVIITGKGAK